MKKINLGQKDVIHFVGIGGIGMSGLAQIMKNMGFKIQGSDQNKNKNTNRRMHQLANTDEHKDNGWETKFPTLKKESIKIYYVK